MKSGVAKATTIVGMILIAGGSLSACDKQSGKESLTVGSGRESGTIDSKFGKGFGTALNAAPNSEPHNVQDGDLAPVSLTTEPEVID